MVYFAISPGGLIRIGAINDRSRRPTRRRSWRRKLPDDCAILGMIPGNRKVARDLHRHFAAHRISAAGSGQFRPAVELLVFIFQAMAAAGGSERHHRVLWSMRCLKTLRAYLPRAVWNKFKRLIM